MTKNHKTTFFLCCQRQIWHTKLGVPERETQAGCVAHPCIFAGPDRHACPCPAGVIVITGLLWAMQALKGHRALWKIEICNLIRVTREWKLGAAVVASDARRRIDCFPACMLPSSDNRSDRIHTSATRHTDVLTRSWWRHQMETFKIR